MKEKSFNKSVCRVEPAMVLVGSVLGGAFSCLALPAAWQMAAEVWNPLSEILGAVTRDGLPTMATLHTQGLGPMEALDALSWATRGASDAVAGTIVGAGALGGVFCSLSRYLRHYDGTWAGPAPAVGAATHGDARIVAEPSVVRKRTRAWRAGSKPEGGSLVVGAMGGNELRLYDSVHFCVLGMSGAGKSRRVILPTLVSAVEQGRSVVVNDIKGELGDWTADWVRSLGTHRVMRLRLDDPASSDVRFDPMARARSYADEGMVGAATSELRELACCVIPDEHGSNTRFFTDGARNLFVGLALHVLTSPDVPDDCRNISSVLAAVTPRGDEDSTARIASLRSSLGERDPALPFLSGVSSDGGGGNAIASTLANRLMAYVDQEVDVLMHDDEVRLDELGEKPTVLYVTSSSAKGDRSALVNTLFSQTLASLRSCARRHRGKCPTEPILIMDEFASIGRCERLLRDIGEMRSEGITVVACWQSLHQLQAVSGYSAEEAKNLLDQLHTKVVLSCGDLDIAKELSETIGSYTVFSQGSSQTRSARGGSTGTSDSRVKRALITPDELMMWKASEHGTLVVTHDGVYALQSRDVSKTFVADLIGLGGSEPAARVERNVDHPKVWVGAATDDGDVRQGADVGAAQAFVPGGFAF